MVRPYGHLRKMDALALVGSAAVSVTAFAIVFANYRPGGVSDWDQIWLAGRAILHGKDPYLAVNVDNSPWGLVYPMPAVLVGLPFCLLPLEVARAIWFAFVAGALAYSWGTKPRWRLVGLFSGGMIWAALGVQWTPLLVASIWLPWCGLAYACKPTTATALWLAKPRALPVVTGVALLAASFAVAPHWIGEWVHATSAVYHEPLVFRPGGFLLLAALARWRRPEARLILAFALIPSSGMPYDLLALYLIAGTKREWMLITLLTQIVAVWGESVWHAGIAAHAFAKLVWPAQLLLGYLPALAMLLLRPNTATPLSVLGGPVAPAAASSTEPFTQAALGA